MSYIFLWKIFLMFWEIEHFRSLFWGKGRGGGAKITPTPPYLKLIRIMLKTWNLVRKYTHKPLRKYIF